MPRPLPTFDEDPPMEQVELGVDLATTILLVQQARRFDGQCVVGCGDRAEEGSDFCRPCNSEIATDLAQRDECETDADSDRTLGLRR